MTNEWATFFAVDEDEEAESGMLVHHSGIHVSYWLALDGSEFDAQIVPYEAHWAGEPEYVAARHGVGLSVES